MLNEFSVQRAVRGRNDGRRADAPCDERACPSFIARARGRHHSRHTHWDDGRSRLVKTGALAGRRLIERHRDARRRGCPTAGGSLEHLP